MSIEIIKKIENHHLLENIELVDLLNSLPEHTILQRFGHDWWRIIDNTALQAMPIYQNMNETKKNNGKK